MRKWHLNYCYKKFVYVLLLLKYVRSHTCSHKSPSNDEVVRGVHLEPHHVMKRRAIDQQLRIHLHYDYSIEGLPDDQQNLIKNDLIARSVPYWERTLSVRHTENAIKLQRQCVNNLVKYRPHGDLHAFCAEGCVAVTKCGETAVPREHLDVCRQSLKPFEYEELGPSGDGVNDTDFILYVSAYHTGRCDVGTTVAYSSYCQQEMAFDRPVAGYVNMCPHAISTEIHHLDQMHSTMRHEILHALGFSVGLFAFFRDSNGAPLTKRKPSTNAPQYNSTMEVYQWSDRIIKTITRQAWRVRGGFTTRQVNLIVTPRVVEEVRNHFNCSSLEGAELEDQDSIGTAYSHWEKRIFENEAMTGGYTQNPLISRVTLALMEDTGWYRANYSMAEPLKWGAGLGCDFVKKSCADWMHLRREQGESIHPFCERVKRSETLHTECTDDYSAVAVCNLVQYDAPLAAQYQYLEKIEDVKSKDVGKYGGSVMLADYCPFVQEFNWRSEAGETVRTSSCVADAPMQLTNNYILEEFGANSRCFEHHEPWEIENCAVTHVVDNWGSGCYKMRCDANYGLIVMVLDMEYQCVNEGDIIRISHGTTEWYHTGSIVCPACDLYCKNPVNIGCHKKHKHISYANEPLAKHIPCITGHGTTVFTHYNIAVLVCSLCLLWRHACWL